MNNYKYWLLSQFDLICDVKGIIRYYAKGRIITPPNYDKLKDNNKDTYVYDDIVYNLSTIECFFKTPHRYEQVVVMVENQKITDITFAYFIPGTLLDSDYKVDFTQSNICNVYLYEQEYDICFFDDNFEGKKKEQIDEDGCYSILGNAIFIVD
jgi:hypothetical protein